MFQNQTIGENFMSGESWITWHTPGLSALWQFCIFTSGNCYYCLHGTTSQGQHHKQANKHTALKEKAHTLQHAWASMVLKMMLTVAASCSDALFWTNSDETPSMNDAKTGRWSLFSKLSTEPDSKMPTGNEDDKTVTASSSQGEWPKIFAMRSIPYHNLKS